MWLMEKAKKMGEFPFLSTDVSSALPWLQKMMIFSLGMERSQQSMYPHGWRGAAGSALLYIYM